MALEFKCKADGSKRYIKRNGNFVFLCRSQKGALNEIPEGWEVRETVKGFLKVVKA